MDSLHQSPDFTIWERLKKISRVSFSAQSGNFLTGWNGRGDGDVNITTGSGSAIIFAESGTWTTISGIKLDFANRYRWSLQSGSNCLELEHLRYGDNVPVKLLELYYAADQHWKTSVPHTCKDDTYTLDIVCTNTQVRMNWRITGPAKNELITYLYH